MDFTREIAGVAPDGRPFDLITWRSMICRMCGQSFRQREFRYRGEKKRA
jgi:hypothetical protein